MYSYEDRMGAVEVFIKLGRRPRATIRELGYPSKNALKGWVREYERRQDLAPGAASRPPKCSGEQKALALEHFATQARCISWTLRALGYTGRATLTAWVREAFPQSHKVNSGARHRVTYLDEVKLAGVVGLYCRQESAQALAEKIGVCRPTLYHWRTQLLGSEARVIMKHKPTYSSPPPPDRDTLERGIEALQRDIRQVQIEHDLLKKASELLKRDMGADLKLLSNGEKTMLIGALKDLYKVPELLAQLRLARSSYVYHRTRMALQDKHPTGRHTMAEIFETLIAAMDIVGSKRRWNGCP